MAPTRELGGARGVCDRVDHSLLSHRATVVYDSD